MIKTLAIDTSTKTASAAILQDETVLYEISVNTGQNHSVVLLPAIDHMMRTAGLSPADVDLFACTVGPGSFTGLRIAAGTVKGMAMASGKPIAAVSTLEALGMNASFAPCPICPLLDARKGQVYAALYTPCAGGGAEKILEDRVASIDSVLLEADKLDRVIFLGDGAAAYQDRISGFLGEKAVFLPPVHQYIRASAVGLLGLRRLKAGEIIDAIGLTPHYLRLSEAEARQSRLS